MNITTNYILLKCLSAETLCSRLFKFSLFTKPFRMITHKPNQKNKHTQNTFCRKKKKISPEHINMELIKTKWVVIIFLHVP